jgi:death-on-curing protein
VKEPIWINKPETLMAHSRQVAEHGGSDGICDEGLLESALNKPRNVFTYEDDCDLPRLAASYAFGIERNHPFIDGNKRTALVVAEGFLRINGLRVISAPEEKYATYLGLAAGEVSEEELAAWFRTHTQPLPKP